MTASPEIYVQGVMDPQLIKTINRLQDAFSTVGVKNPIDLPQITVVGSQSSGKSSVLENIVGRDFLPRGTGIVTRRPLILQLIHRPKSQTAENDQEHQANEKSNTDSAANKDEWGEFLHLPGKKFFDFNKIREEIILETEAKTGKNVGISSLPINLRIYSPNVLTLTLVDLPGLTKVPVGDQPKDIERQIRDMILQYISKPNAIILSVTAGNTDLANSDGLKLAREVDPEGTRTVGVLTKIDLMDPGTDVVEVLANRVIPLRLGFVPVINRGQRDIDQRKSIRAALEYEKNFFENHASYKAKAQYCGTPYLAKRLNMILMHHIKNLLPEIKSHIASALANYQMELQSLGNSYMDNSSNTILNIITLFCNDFRTVLDGKSDNLSSAELSGGARISFVYHELFSNGVRAIDPFDQVKDLDIRTILYNSSGSSPALFVGTAAFEVIVKQQIRRLEEPSLKCVTLIYDELVRILTQLLTKPVFKRYPALHEQVHRVVVSFFKRAIEPSSKLVKDIIAAEACYINTGHPDFISGNKAMAMVNEKYAVNKTPVDPKTGKPLASQHQSNNVNSSVDVESNGFFGSFFASKNKKKLASMEPPPPVLKASGVLSEKEQIETEVIKILIQSYFNIVKRTVIDMIPKAIMLHLVTFSRDNLQKELLENLYKSEIIDDLLKESEITVNRRKECQRMMESLLKAQDIVAQTG